jgi:hypothetical protein
MALKGDRYEVVDDISFFMNETATRGGIVCYSTAGSGAALDQSAALATYKATISGSIPIGMLMNDVVNLDLTRQHLNQHKDEVQQGRKVRLMTEGWAVTNMIYPGVTPTAGQTAYLAHSGYITSTEIVGVSNPEVAQIGRFMSTKDEDGYAKVYVKLPNALLVI